MPRGPVAADGSVVHLGRPLIDDQVGDLPHQFVRYRSKIAVGLGLRHGLGDEQLDGWVPGHQETHEVVAIAEHSTERVFGRTLRQVRDLVRLEEKEVVDNRC